MKNICDMNCLKTLITERAGFKDPDKLTCIDLILRNRPNLFQYSSTFETGLSDFHLLTVTEFKMEFHILKPKISAYRDFKSSDNAKFRYDIVTANFNADNFGIYESTIFNAFNCYVPIKKKYIPTNEAPFTSKELRKAIMEKRRLRNIFLKHRTDTNKLNYNTQRNICTKLLKDTKKSYSENLDTKKLLITEFSGELLYHYLPNIHQKGKKLTSLMT